MNAPSDFSESKADRWLEQRVGRLHLRQRLGIEQDHESQVIGRGRNLFHIKTGILFMILYS